MRRWAMHVCGRGGGGRGEWIVAFAAFAFAFALTENLRVALHKLCHFIQATSQNALGKGSIDDAPRKSA